MAASAFRMSIAVSLVVAGGGGALMGICPNARYPAPYAAYDSYCQLVGDFDRNGVQDLVFVGATAVFTHMNGNPDTGARLPSLAFGSAKYVTDAAQLVDVSGDGIPDLTFNTPSGTHRYNGMPSGFFDPNVVLPPPVLQPKQLVCSTISTVYSGVSSLQCPGGAVLAAATCDNGAGVVIADQSAPLPPGAGVRVWYLTPSASAATGVHCELPTTTKSTMSVRCCQ